MYSLKYIFSIQAISRFSKTFIHLGLAQPKIIKIPVFLIFNMVVQNKKSGISSLCSLTGECATQKIKNKTT